MYSLCFLFFKKESWVQGLTIPIRRRKLICGSQNYKEKDYKTTSSPPPHLFPNKEKDDEDDKSTQSSTKQQTRSLCHWVRNNLLDPIYMEGNNKWLENHECSKWQDVMSGIPQGSVIRPLLFMIFINDQLDIVDFSVHLFVDDAKMFLTVDTKESVNALQTGLDKFAARSISSL